MRGSRNVTDTAWLLTSSWGIFNHDVYKTLSPLTLGQELRCIARLVWMKTGAEDKVRVDVGSYNFSNKAGKAKLNKPVLGRLRGASLLSKSRILHGRLPRRIRCL